MLEFLGAARRYLWAFIELAFLAVLAIILIYLLLGENSGVFVTSVVGNVTKLANGLQTASLVGLAIILGIVYLVAQRAK
jgi:hypothetical protein